MNSDFIMKPRIVLGFANRQFSIFTAELIPFLKVCEGIGLPSSSDVGYEMEQIKDLVISNNTLDADSKIKHLLFIDAMAVMLRGAIYENV